MSPLWPGWESCGNGLYRCPDGTLRRDRPPPWPTPVHRIAVVGCEGLGNSVIAAALTRSHRHRPMTLLLHTAPPPDLYCRSHGSPGYVHHWATSWGVPLEPLPADWPARAAELVDGVIDLRGDAALPPGVRIWRRRVPSI